MTIKDNYIINEDFTDKENEYYVIFQTPGDETRRIEKIEKIQLKRINDDSIELQIKNNERTYVYHYVNELISLLDKFDIGFN